jgi:hypothetical protein
LSGYRLAFSKNPLYGVQMSNDTFSVGSGPTKRWVNNSTFMFSLVAFSPVTGAFVILTLKINVIKLSPLFLLTHLNTVVNIHGDRKLSYYI